ncbi:MAG: MBL fold metallo-hydrolase, partial [Bacillota bacterium]|nr:MBL fold metallo-hydrolase [Bacillota bacterium]
MFYTIYPLYNGNFSVVFKTISQNLPELKNIPSFAFLLQHEDGELILVDTGFAINHIPGVNSKGNREPEQELHNAVRALGFDPLSISTVILTHLHWDHTAGMYLFPNATFCIQGEEFRSLFSLNPNEETYYAPAHWLPLLSCIHLVEGNIELRPGLRLIVTGEHTAGHQVVEVQTKEGLYLLGGDAPFNYDQLWKLIPPEGWQ